MLSFQSTEQVIENTVTESVDADVDDDDDKEKEEEEEEYVSR